MPEGRAERAVEAGQFHGESMDDAEHSATLERVVAGHEAASQTREEAADVIVV